MPDKNKKKIAYINGQPVGNELAIQLGTNINGKMAQNPAYYARRLYEMKSEPEFEMSKQSIDVTSEMLANDPILSQLKVQPSRALQFKNTKTGNTHYFPSYKSEEINPHGWNMYSGELPEMSLGGILAEVGTGAGTGALSGSVIPGLGNIGGALIGGGVGLIKGLTGHFAEKKAEKAEKEAKLEAHNNMVTGMQNYQQMYNPFAKTIAAMGGQIPQGANVELEKEEVFQTPDGQVGQVDAPSHANGGIDMNLQPGTRVYSDRLKASTGKTFAEEAEKIKKQMAKYEKILS